MTPAFGGARQGVLDHGGRRGGGQDPVSRHEALPRRRAVLEGVRPGQGLPHQRLDKGGCRRLPSLDGAEQIESLVERGADRSRDRHPDEHPVEPLQVVGRRHGRGFGGRWRRSADRLRHSRALRWTGRKGAGARHLDSKLAHRQAPGPPDPILKRLRVGYARHDHRRDPTERPAAVLAGQRRLKTGQPVERLAQKRQIPQPAPATPEALARVVVETREAELTPSLPADKGGRRSRQRHGDAIQGRPQRQRHPVGDADLPLDH